MDRYVRFTDKITLSCEYSQPGSYGLVLPSESICPDAIAVRLVDALKSGFTEYDRCVYEGEYEWMPEGFEPDWTPTLWQHWKKTRKTYEFKTIVYWRLKTGGTIYQKEYKRHNMALKFAYGWVHHAPESMVVKETVHEWKILAGRNYK